MEFYSTVAQLLPILTLAMLLETRYAERMQARLRTLEPRGLPYRVLSFYARGALPWLQLVALCAAFTAEILAVRVLAVGQDSQFVRNFLEYTTYVLVGVLVMGLVDVAARQV